MQDSQRFVQQIEKIDALIRNKRIEREQWEAVALGITSPSIGDKVQSSGNPQKMADAISTFSDIDRRIDELLKQRQEIISVIERLKVKEYDLLHKVYVQHMSLKEAAFALDKTYSNITTLHGMALKNLQIILDEKG